MQANTFIPRRLDDQWKLGLWDLDVASPVLVGGFLGFVIGTKVGFCLLTCLGLYVARWLGRKKSDKHPAFVMHWLYWHLPVTAVTSLRATPPSCLRRMVG